MPGAGAPSSDPARDPLRTVRPLGARLLWPGPDPLWAVGDWRPEEIRLVTLGRDTAAADAVATTGFPDLPPDPDDVPAREAPAARLAVVGLCGAGDAELRAGLATARGGALRHLTAWPGGYTVVLRIGTRTVVLTDLAGVLPVFHTPWCGGTAYATAALPLADLVGTGVDVLHLAARLACPESPEAVGTGTPYAGVLRVPPAHALTIRAGRPQVTSYDVQPPTAGGPAQLTEAPAVSELTRSLIEGVRCRVRAPGAPQSPGLPPRPRIGADVSGGSASTTLALLAAEVPAPGPETGPADASGPAADHGEARRHPVAVTVPPRDTSRPHAGRRRSGAVPGSWVRTNGARPQGPAAPLAAVTFADATTTPASPHPELVRARALAEGTPRLRHLIVPGGAEALPYADLVGDPLDGRLTDEPGPGLVTAARDRSRLARGGTDHLTGYGARQALDGHPARLADLVRDHRRRHLVAPVSALARADTAAAGLLTGALTTPVSVYRAARRLARTPYADGLEDAATRLLARRFGGRPGRPDERRAAFPGPGAASVEALAWCVPGPAARWLSDAALAEVAVRLRIAARRPAPSERPGERRARLALHRHAADLRILVQAVEQHGQRVHAPFLDNQVVRACRLIPDALRVQPGARHALLRSVLAGVGAPVLPADWGAAGGPGPQALARAAVRAGLRRAADGLAELFDAPLLAQAGLIDLVAVRTALAGATAGAAGIPLDGLADLVATELWLRRLQARTGSCWTGLPVAERRALAAGRIRSPWGR